MLFHQFVRYLISGGLAALTHIVTLGLLVEVGTVPRTTASALGFVVAVLLNYGLQQQFVFASDGQHGLRFPRFVLVTALTGSLNVGLFWLLVEFVHWHYMPAQVLVLGVLVPVNFLLNRFFTFRATVRLGGASG